MRAYRYLCAAITMLKNVENELEVLKLIEQNKQQLDLFEEKYDVNQDEAIK